MLKHLPTVGLLLMASFLMPQQANAQISQNPYKFLGNITTGYQMDAGGGVPKFYQLWNQVTCENESKWSSVEGNRGNFNWSGADNAFNYAKNHNFTYKFHALVWGAQYPGWLESLSAKERFSALTNWFNKAKTKYKTLPMIDVVNEAVGMHQQGNPMMKETLGGGGKTGYDWLIKAFEMAYERWPDAILIYNDYNSIQWDIDSYIDLVSILRDAGAPIDAYGNQSHDVTDISESNLKKALKKQQDALKMPMFITELDIDKADDAQQKAQYQKVLPAMWEAPYCAGVTLWGYVLGRTWVDNSGLYRNGTERPAMTWIKEYMETDAAKNAVGPFPGTKKEASIYIRPASLKVAKNDVQTICVRAKLATKTIAKVDFYVGEELVGTKTEAPYIFEYTSSKTGWLNTKAVVTATDSTTYERYGRYCVLSSTTKREPYNETVPQIPGVINVTEYDKGASGVTYSSASRTNSATKDGAWMEYTVDVAEDGIYAIDAEVASNKNGGMFHLAEYAPENLTYITEYLTVPKTEGINDYHKLHYVTQDTLRAGRHVITLLVDKGGFYLKSLTFKRYEEDKSMAMTINSIQPSTVTAGDTTVISVTPRSTNSPIAEVNIYANDLLIGTMTEFPETTPYKFEYVPTMAGSQTIIAVVTNADGKSKTSAKKTLKVNALRGPYKNVITIPGFIQAEDFDKGGEGVSFHDKDSNDEGDANYRTDNEGLDLVKGNNGTAIGYTAKDEWTEYSVNVTEPGEYSFEAICSNGSNSNGGFSISLVKGKTVTQIGAVKVTATGGWNTYKTMKGNLTKKLAEGEQILRFTITDGNCNIDKVKFICTLNTGIESVIMAEPTKEVIYNLKGQKVDANYKGLIIKNGRKILMKR